MLTFRNALIKIGTPIPMPVYNAHNPFGLKLLTRLRIGVSHLNQRKFNHNFQDCLNPLCSSRLEVESISHFFLHCHYYSNISSTLLNELQPTEIDLLNQEGDRVLKVLLDSSTKFNTNQDFRLLSSSISYALKSVVYFHDKVKEFLSLFCHTFILKFTGYDIVMWGYPTLFSTSIISGLPNG